MFAKKITYLRMAIEYVDILTEENLSSIQVAYMELICWSVCLFSMMGGDGIRGVVERYRYFSQL